MVSEAHYEVHVSLSHARDKTKNLFPYFFNELKSLNCLKQSILWWSAVQLNPAALLYTRTDKVL